MNTSPTSTQHVHPVIYQQDRYDRRRRFLRDWLLRPIGFGILVRVRVQGREHIPADGPTMIMMNHIGAIDPFVVVGATRPRYLVPMTKVENYENPIVSTMINAWGAYPVRRGEVDRQALESSIQLLHQNRPILIAPEGTRRPELSEAKDGITYVALKASAVIVPTALEGTDQFPRRYKRLRRPQVQVTFGRPFRFRADGRSRIPRDEMHQMTQEAMYQLAALLPEHRRGFYHDLSQMTTNYLEFV
jgi:1-acyl-sn-glycerol-3-phosphate acyltransferase